MSKAIIDFIVKELTSDKELSEMWQNLKKKRIGAITRFVLEDAKRKSPELYSSRSYMIAGPTGEYSLLNCYQNIMKGKLGKKLEDKTGKSVDEEEFKLIFLEAKDVLMEIEQGE